MRRTRVVIQSRLNSSRLPGKALLTMAGMPMIELVARRASRSGHEVVVATSEEQYDARIAEHLERVGIPVMRGALDDVLGRFAAATADLAPDDRVVRLTGDNPVADADLVDELIAAMEASGHAYGRVDIDQVPEGLGAEAFSVGSLRAADQAAAAAYDREHVTPWLRRELGELLFVPVGSPRDIRAFRCTVDSLADYDRAARLFDAQPDPVAARWLDLVDELGRRVHAGGPTVPLRDPSGPAQSALVLGAAHYGAARDADTPAPPAAELRALLSLAVEHGITHVEVGRADGGSEAAFQAGSEPALKQRLGVISRLGPLAAPSGARGDLVAALTEAGIERSLSHLGRRKVAALLFPSLADALAGDGAAWRTVTTYRESGVAERIGVCLDAPQDLDRVGSLPGLDYLEVPLSPADRRWLAPEPVARLEALAAAGTVVVGHSPVLHGVLAGRPVPAADASADLSAEGRSPADELAAEGQALAAAAARMATELGRDGVVDLCLAHGLAQPWLTSLVIGCASAAEVREAVAATGRAPLTAGEGAAVADGVPQASEALLAALATAQAVPWAPA